MRFFYTNPFTCCTVILLLLALQAVSQPPKFSYEKYGYKGDTLKYRRLEPDYNPARKYPLVIFLHGSGERGNDNNAQLKWGVMNFATDEAMAAYPAIVIAPQCPTDMTWSNLEGNFTSGAVKLKAEPTKPMTLLISLIKELIKNAPVDSNRIYITGLSMGGFGTFDAIERYPGLFAAAVPVCGGGDTSRVAAISNIPIWIFHGAEDPAVTVKYATNMLNALQMAGAHPGFTIYPETGHFSWLAAYSDPLMMAWMFRQHKQTSSIKK